MGLFGRREVRKRKEPHLTRTPTSTPAPRLPAWPTSSWGLVKSNQNDFPISPGGPVHGPKTVDQGLRRRVQRCPAFLTHLCQCRRTCRTRRRRVLRSPHQVRNRVTRVYAPQPSTISDEEIQKATIKRMIDMRVNPIIGLASRYDYEKNEWKEK